MKKLFFLFMICSAFNAAAQQKPVYTQYIMNNYILNPALAGIENYTDIKLSYRNQWTGLDGAPVTTYLSIQGPLQQSDKVRVTPTSFDRAGVNVRGKDYWDEYTAPDPHSGAGIVVMNDKTGYINRFSLYGSYAYHKPLGVRTTLAAGFSAGFTSVSIDASKVVLDDPQGPGPTPDPALANATGGRLLPEVGAGLWLYSRDYFVGLSALNIVVGKARFTDTSKYGGSYVPHFFASAGYRLLMGGDMSVLPSVVVQSISPLPPQVHANIKFQWQDKVWFGGSYRFGDQLGGFAAMAGVNISHTINIGYSYDTAPGNRLRGYAGDTHEILIGFLLNNKYGDSCPRNVW
ncbi:MAG: type IX secretion system membrane protein PorP/SprF [Ferruginibacter sp.]